MKQNKAKHIILVVIIISMAIVSILYMRNRDYAQKNKRIAVVYPKNNQTMIQEVQEGIQDYAYDHYIQCDIWYKETMSSNDLDTLVEEEHKNQAMGILLVYPEKYMKKEKYKYSNVLALTDMMQPSFTYSASFSQVFYDTVRLPVDFDLLKEIKDGQRKPIYLENTYKLGYKSMEMIEGCVNESHLSNIRLKPDKIDQEVLEKGSKASLFCD